MSRIAYVNGRYLPHRSAAVPVEDRAYQFADGVYEVTAVRGGKLVDEVEHFDRLERSLGELKIAMPMSRRSLSIVLRETARRNRVRDGIVYLQISRGVARRDHAFPAGTAPSVVATARVQDPARAAKLAATGVAVIAVTDIRWGRCDIKSVSLLPNVLAKQQAREAGAFEAWLVDGDGYVTEGSSTNAWIVDGKGNLVTRYPDNAILAGVTRRVLLQLAARERLKLIERKFNVSEAQRAREAFLTSTTSMVVPVISIDGQTVGDGKPGPLTVKLRELYQAAAAI